MARVLVVDDDPDTTESCALLLTIWGHEAQKATDSDCVLQLALEFRPDVVLLDIGLPRRDGYAVLKQLRESPRLSSTVVAAVTGFACPEVERKSIEAGFDACFPKPVDLECLRRYLADVARRSTSK